jgi:hypothetical protein
MSETEGLAAKLIWMARRPDIAGPHGDVAVALYDAAKAIDMATYERMCLHLGPIITQGDVARHVENYIDSLTEKEGHEKSVMDHCVDALKQIDRADIDVTVDPFRRNVHLLNGGVQFAVFRYYFPGEKR